MDSSKLMFFCVLVLVVLSMATAQNSRYYNQNFPYYSQQQQMPMNNYPYGGYNSNYGVSPYRYGSGYDPGNGIGWMGGSLGGAYLLCANCGRG
uniref:Uncharacterized protein n=1 Tax=Panagrellus redivivus TaxID=6233 RepID=A0A7E4W6T9_PANRE